MKGVIKGVLAEELANSLRMKKNYEKELRQLPPGALTVRKIKGHEYYYLARRVAGKVRHVYKGKLSPSEKRRYKEIMAARAKYRSLVSQVKKQIKFLRSSLRGKEAV